MTPLPIEIVPSSATPQNPLTTPTRSFTREQQRKLIEMLRATFPENGHAKIEIMDNKDRPYGDRLRDALNSAGWEVQYNTTAQNRHVSGIQVVGWNGLFIESLSEILRNSGLTDARAELVPNEIPRDNPKWPVTQKRARINFGYEEPL
jgi:hypothetical protein